MDDFKKAALIVIGADWIFNEGKLSKFLIEKFTEALKIRFSCEKEDILRNNQPKCYECKSSEKCLTEAAFGC